MLKELSGTGKGRLYDMDFNLLKEVKVSDIYNEVKNSKETIKTLFLME